MSPTHVPDDLAVDRAAQELITATAEVCEKGPEATVASWARAASEKFPKSLGYTVAPSRLVTTALRASTAEEAIEIAREAVRTRHTAQALGDAIHAAKVTASPALAAATQARENLYDAIDAEFGLLSSTEAGEAMGSRSTAARNAATKARRDGRALALTRSNYTLFPGFQFNEAGLRPVIKQLIEVGDEYDRTETGLIQWLVSPTTYLHGERPVDVIDEPGKLLETARSAFGVQW